MRARKWTCDVEGCHRTHRAKGFCELHYNRLRARGRPEGDGRPTPEDYARRRAEAKRLRAGGLTLAETGRMVGVATSTVHKWDRKDA